MSIDADTVNKIAHLARLAINDEQADSYAKELSGILDLVEQMSAVDTENVTPMAHPSHAAQRLRPDAVTETNKREHYQEHAPAVDEGLFLVPRVIE